MGWCNVVPGSVTGTQATLQAYVYKVWTITGYYLGWYPTSPSNVTFAYSALDDDPPAAPQNLTATCDGGTIRLDWTPNTEPDLDKYCIYRKVISGSFSLAGTTTNTYWYDPGNHDCTLPEFPFYYYVKAKDVSALLSDPSDTVTIYTFFKDVQAGLPEELLPESYALHPAHPNPFNPSTSIEYDLPEASRVTLAIYDIMGREVIRWEGQEPAGYRQGVWYGKDKSGRSVPAGIYIYRLVASSTESDERFTASRKMVFMK
ncbi:MAG: FlgD immunoglobulin-like domain containing protein [Candidatus Neomarinimicrobiota bacterium]